MDVDPVVREPGRLRDDQRDGEEVAVAQRLGGRATSSGGSGSIARISSPSGIDETTASAAKVVPSATATAVARPARWVTLVDRAVEAQRRRRAR